MDTFTPEQLEQARGFTQAQIDLYNQSRSAGADVNTAFGAALLLGAKSQKEKETVSVGIATRAAQAARTAAGFIGGGTLAEGAGQALASGYVNRLQTEADANAAAVAENLQQAIREAREAGDSARVARYTELLGELEFGTIQQQFAEDLPENREIVGDALRLAGTATGAFAGLRAAGAVTGGPLRVGAVTGGIEGAVTGALWGAGDAVADDADPLQIALRTLEGGAAGGALGAGLGGALGGAISIAPAVGRTASRQSQRLRELFKRAPETPSSVKTTVATGANVPPDVKNPQIFSDAVARGYTPQQARLFANLEEVDRDVARRMLELAEDVSAGRVDASGQRPIDLVGRSLGDRVRELREIQRRAGRGVNEAAEGLRGVEVDATPLFNTIEETLADFGIRLLRDTTGTAGIPNFEGSQFALSEPTQKEIARALDFIFSPKKDAYAVHTIKKTLDGLIEGGTQAEGLRGSAKRLIQQLRKNIDDFLDTRNKTYDAANTEFKAIIDVLEAYDDVFRGTSDSRTAQNLRGLFSNRQTRSEIADVLAQIDALSSKYGLSDKGSYANQALFAEQLEDIFGTQAITGLRGQTERAVRGVRAFAEGLRNPIRGLGSVAGDIVEAVARQRPSDRIQFLREILGNAKPVTTSTGSRAATQAEIVLDTLNPTGGVFVDYVPAQRATMPLGENITTLAETMGRPPSETITIYRGVPRGTQQEIVPGDFITTNEQLARDYAGNGDVISLRVKLKDVLDDLDDPLGEEYIYRPTK